MNYTTNGRDMMIFADMGDGNGYHSIAWATSHALNMSVNVQTYSTKDSPYTMSEAETISWEITSDNLYSDEGYSYIYNCMLSQTPITVQFGLKKDEGGATVADGNIPYWQRDPEADYYVGKVIPSSLDLTAENGQKCTFSATFTGIGKLVRKSDIHRREIPLDEWTTEDRTALAAVDEYTLIQLRNFPSGGATANWTTWTISDDPEEAANGEYMGIGVMLSSVGAYYTECMFRDIDDVTNFKTLKIEFDFYVKMTGTRQFVFADGSTHTFSTTHKYEHIIMNIEKPVTLTGWQIWDCPNLYNVCNGWGYKNFKITYTTDAE